MKIKVKPLTAESFAPYGDVLTVPREAGRTYYEEALGNLRESAHASLSLVHKPAVLATNSIQIELLERHEFSSQTFVPLSDVKWLIVVCPHSPQGGPDTAQSVAFLADGSQGVTYRANTWHHGLTVLQGPGKFAVFMWRDGTTGDEQFVKVVPFTVDLE